MKKGVVFGGTGWVGHNVALMLQEEGYDVTICARGKFQSFTGNVSSIKNIAADKDDEETVRKIFEDAVYDLIVDTIPRLKTISYIRKYAKGLKHYIHCSSTGGYAPLPFVPCDETAPYIGFDKTSGWRTKALVDAEVLNAFATEGFPATVIRPCYITGPGMLPLDNLGGRRKDYISDILAEKVLDVPGDGQALLQPIHVKDLAKSFILAARNPHRSTGQIYNICLSHAVPLWKYHELTAAALGKKVHLNFMSVEDLAKKYEGEVHEIGLRFVATHMSFTIEKAIRDLGYKPHCTPEEAIEETAIWAASLL